MKSRERVLAAFEPGGTTEIAAVASYEGLFLRDHFAEITALPWWDADRSELARDFFAATGLAWFSVYPCASREERARRRVEQRADGVWLIDTGTGERRRLQKPQPSGVGTSLAQSLHTDLDALPATEQAIDRLVGRPTPFDRARFLAEGRHDVAAAVRAETELFLYSSVSSPVWSLYDLFGYEGMMVLLARDPDLAAYAGRRLLAHVEQQVKEIAALGADAVWIEECLTDQISPRLFERVNLPLVQGVVAAIRAAGMKSIYYYCGSPHDRLDAILAAGADAVHFEEGKKGFTLDIAEIVARVDGRCVVFGNLDAIGVLEQGSDEGLRAEIARQVAAGWQNGGRFVMSVGSPITPGTGVARVRRYAEMVRGEG